jgi:uncharacterized cupin superfamily protein
LRDPAYMTANGEEFGAWVTNVAELAAGEDGWEPMVVNDRSIGEVKWLRREEDEGRLLLVGLWRSLIDIEYDYVFEAEESYFVLEGEQRLRLASGREVVTASGDAGTFQKGLSCQASVAAPFLEFFVINS